MGGTELAGERRHFWVRFRVVDEDQSVGGPGQHEIDVKQTIRDVLRPGRSAPRGTPTPVRIASRSARDRVSIKRIGKSWSRGRSCLAQLPKRSCKITGTFVNDRPLSFDFC